MKTFSDDDSLRESRLYIFQRLIQKLPHGRVRKKLLLAFRKFMMWYNLKYHNLPEQYPTDFSFQRTGQFSRKSEKITTLISIALSSIVSEKKIFKYERNPETNKNEYVLKSHQRYNGSISETHKRKLYATIRKTGFLHFELENMEVSFDNHSRTGYILRAHGKTYSFIGATEAPIQTIWEEKCMALDNLLNELADSIEKSNLVELK
jgi:hypothetical protein